MASPQTENGYTRIANELFDAILAFPFSKRELLIVLGRAPYGARGLKPFALHTSFVGG